MSDYFDLGSFTREVTTSSQEAQVWFTRGVVWTDSFNQEEDGACFERAIASDPGCALAYWGLAYALGPNYNKPWESFDPADLSSSLSRAYAATAEAVSRAPGASDVERALVDALVSRYPSAAPTGDWSAWNAAYAAAMRHVYRAYPDDLDVAALFAEALMNLTPWALWDLATGAPAAGSEAIQIQQVLDRSLTTADGPTRPLEWRRGVVRGAAPTGAGGAGRGRGGDPRGRGGGGGPADGGLARGIHGDEGARGDPLRPLAGHYRRAAARRPGAVLREHGHDALCQRCCLCGQRPHRGS